MDKLKELIINRFDKYLCKLSKGYTLDPKEYKCILEAMRWVNASENFTFDQYTIDATTSYHIIELNK